MYLYFRRNIRKIFGGNIYVIPLVDILEAARQSCPHSQSIFLVLSPLSDFFLEFTFIHIYPTREFITLERNRLTSARILTWATQ